MADSTLLTAEATVLSLPTEFDFDPTLSFLDNLDSISSSMPLAWPHQAPIDAHGDSLSSCSKETESNEAATEDMAVPTRKRMKTYQRQKLESESLRSQVSQLNAQLQRLQQAAQLAPGDERSRGHEPDLHLSGRWASIAARQLEARKRAEQENAKLRQALDWHFRVAQNIDKWQRKRMPFEMECVLAQHKRVCSQRWHDLHRRVDSIRDSIASRFGEVTEMMEQCRLDTADDDVERLRTATDGVSMEMTVAKTFPFPLSKVADALWQSTSARSIKLERGCFDGSQCSDTLSTLEVQSSVTVRRVETPLVFRGFGARQTEHSTATIVFESVGIAEATAVMNEQTTLRERGYVLIEERESPCGQPHTTVKVFIRLEAEYDDARDSEPRVGWLVDLVGGLYKDTGASIFQLIENELVLSSRPCEPTDDSARLHDPLA